MKTRRRFLAAATMLAQAPLAQRWANAATFEYKLAHDLPDSHPLGVNANEFAAAVGNESKGRLSVKVFPNSTLGSDASMVVQLRTGALEMLLEGVGPLSEVSPLAQLSFVGFAFPNREAAIAATDGGVGNIIRRDLEAKGIVAFETAWPNEFTQLATWTRPIRTVDDLQGLKLRVPPGPINVDMFKILGASPAAISYNELYTALQTHLVDGTTGPFTTIWTSKFYEVQRYVSVTNHQWVAYYFCINAAKWSALPADLQEILRRNANRYGLRERRAVQLQNSAAADLLVRSGLKMNRTDTATFRAKLGSYYSHWKTEFGSTAWAVLEQYSGKLS